MRGLWSKFGGQARNYFLSQEILVIYSHFKN